MPTARELELQHQYKMKRLRAFSSFGEQFLRFLSIAVVCICSYLAVRELAGRQTIADVRFRMLADLKANRWWAVAMPWVTTVAATGWGAGERYLRKRHIKRISSENSQMQANINPERRSSSLSKKGDTSPEDL